MKDKKGKEKEATDKPSASPPPDSNSESSKKPGGNIHPSVRRWIYRTLVAVLLCLSIGQIRGCKKQKEVQKMGPEPITHYSLQLDGSKSAPVRYVFWTEKNGDNVLLLNGIKKDDGRTANEQIRWNPVTTLGTGTSDLQRTETSRIWFGTTKLVRDTEMDFAVKIWPQAPGSEHLFINITARDGTKYTGTLTALRRIPLR